MNRKPWKIILIAGSFSYQALASDAVIVPIIEPSSESNLSAFEAAYKASKEKSDSNLSGTRNTLKGQSQATRQSMTESQKGSSIRKDSGSTRKNQDPNRRSGRGMNPQNNGLNTRPSPRSR